MPPLFASLPALFMGLVPLGRRTKGENGLKKIAGARVGDGGHNNIEYNPVFRGMVGRIPANF